VGSQPASWSRPWGQLNPTEAAAVQHTLLKARRRGWQGRGPYSREQKPYTGWHSMSTQATCVVKCGQH
jgi:hypothetical protein